jgi:DNA-binding CsgD family transcriptional regulator
MLAGTLVQPSSGPDLARLQVGGEFEILTPREREVLQLIVAGQTNRQIANCLVVSPETVKTHVRHVLGKMGVNRKAELRALLDAARYA